jgi:O-acetyl-ADP-ribose deacetylase (regulator of RNase III)
MIPRIELHIGDITRLAVDAIVNAANVSLRGGGGVDGAIHRAAGPELMTECIALGGCPIGQARITRGFRLPAKYVIHTVGPMWRGGRQGEDETLASCYRAALRLALEHSLKSIAFPSISTGAFGFPPDRAAEVSFEAVRSVLKTEPSLARVVFCCFDERAAEHYRPWLGARGVAWILG